MDKIAFMCECCNSKTNVERTKKDPPGAIAGRCNYCPTCEGKGKMSDYYEEWFIDENGNTIEL